MANWRGAFRTNYFKVKDVAAFEAWVESLLSEDEVDILRKEDKVGFGAYGPIPYDRTLTEEEFQNLPAEVSEYLSDDATYTDAYPESDGIDILAELASHLQEGEIAIITEAGYEKLRYVSGVATAIDHTGKIIAQQNLDLAPLLPEGVSLPSY